MNYQVYVKQTLPTVRELMQWLWVKKEIRSVKTKMQRLECAFLMHWFVRDISFVFFSYFNKLFSTTKRDLAKQGLCSKAMFVY